MSSNVRIFQSGGFSAFYVVQSTATGKTLYTSPSIFAKWFTTRWCVQHGYGKPTAADFNG
jgi:hypothetical protein